ncbi:V4R domain-containing protein [Thermococcus stetteri]|uniref:V4R domain-containing protein n=1 Tax=Thermococcus stetteri TaxID=49900 RepID=UPI001FD741CD|nr:V4R domain-containing protein [Thermococcus stetteri]
MLKTKIKQVDDALGGGMVEGSAVAFVGSLEYDNIVLMHQVTLNALKDGKKALLATFRQAPDTLLREAEHNGIDYAPFIEKGSLVILDGYTNLYAPGLKQGENILSNPLDIGITTAVIRDSLSKGNFEVLIIDDLTAQYTLQPNPKGYIKTLVRLINSVKSMGITAMTALCKDVFEKVDLAAVLIPFDYVFEVSQGRIKILRSLKPLRTANPIFQYVRTPEGIKLILEEYATVESIKKRLKAESDGTLWLDWDRVEIITESSERATIETAYEFLGPEKGKEFLYLWGKKQFIGLGKDARKRTNSLKSALEEIVLLTRSSGGGILEIMEIKDDLILITGKNLFPRSKGSALPYHVHYAGSIAQFLTEFTGKKWEGKETKCEAMGADHCGFVFWPVE